jgi:AcrR family transcriptional regulator
MAQSKRKQPRSYKLGRRGESAEETRRRIVQATFDLHGEQGIADTTMKQIAERAGVSIGTVYHHFPTDPDAIAACGAHTAVHVPAPTAAIFEGAASRRARIERLFGAFFAYYERLPALASVRRDQHLAAPLREYAAHEAALRRDLAARAIGAPAKDARVTLAAALVDFDVHSALTRQGYSTREAAAKAAALANAWLDAHDKASTP